MPLQSADHPLPPPPTIPVTIHLPLALYELLQLHTPAGADPSAVIVEALERYLASLPAQDRPIESLGLSARALNALTAAGIRSVGEVVGMTRGQLGTVRGCGKKTVREIEEKLGRVRGVGDER